MNSWNVKEIQVRRDATEAFCRFLCNSANQLVRDDLIRESAQGPSGKTKKLFAQLGEFYLEGEVPPGETVNPIPKETVFRVYAQTPKEDRDMLVTMVLPEQPMDPTAEFEATEHYRCTYWPYVTGQLRLTTESAGRRPRPKKTKRKPARSQPKPRSSRQS